MTTEAREREERREKSILRLQYALARAAESFDSLMSLHAVPSELADERLGTRGRVDLSAKQRWCRQGCRVENKDGSRAAAASSES